MRTLAYALPLSLLVGCGGHPDGGKLVQSSKARLPAATAPAADVSEQSTDDTSTAFALYHQLATTPGNLFFSPYSISSALAMAWAGANGDTATQMATALGFSMPLDRTSAAFNALDQALAARAQEPASDGKADPFTLAVANAIWAQDGLTLGAPFLDTLAQNFGAGVRLEPFATKPEPSRQDIDAWVSDQTHGKIPELLAQGDVTQDTRVVLTNAVYFKARWQTPFAKDATAPAPWHALDGSMPSVPLMHATLQEAGYAAGDGWQAAQLPYANPNLALMLIVPDAGRFAAIEAQLDASLLDDVLTQSQPTTLTLALPKLDLATTMQLTPILQALGMVDAFRPDRADFSPIDGQHDLSIDTVVHKATVTVDEEGTEATAATGVGVGTAAGGGPQATLTIDRPFFVAIRDVPTGTLLFLGRVTQP